MSDTNQQSPMIPAVQLSLFPVIPSVAQDKLLAFDLEIVKPIPDGETDWKKHRPLGISCAAIAEPGEEPILWYPGKSRGIIPGIDGGGLSRWELAGMVQYLLAKIERGYTVFTWNGLAFDFDILAEESGLIDQCKELALNHIDMMFHFFCMRGHFLGLDTAARSMGLSGKPEGITGAVIPQMWANSFDDRKKVLGYVANDATLTLNLAQAVIARGNLEWVSKSGRWNSCEFPLGWLPVKQAMRLPEPDTSWMSNPVSRKSLYAWTGIESQEAI